MISILRGAWSLILCFLAGVWLMAAPAVLTYTGQAATNDRIVGPLIASFAFVAISEATRGLRWLNVPLGAWLLLAPFLWGYETVPLVNSLVTGVVVIGLSVVRGTVTERFGGGWSSLLPGAEPAGSHSSDGTHRRA